MHMGVNFIEYFGEYVARFCVSMCICNYKKFDTIYVRKNDATQMYTFTYLDFTMSISHSPMDIEFEEHFYLCL